MFKGPIMLLCTILHRVFMIIRLRGKSANSAQHCYWHADCTQIYETSSQMSIEFEVDGPYKVSFAFYPFVCMLAELFVLACSHTAHAPMTVCSLSLAY